MTWRRVGTIYLVLAALVSYFALFERAPQLLDPAAAPPTAERSLLRAGAEDVMAVTFRRPGAEVRAVRAGGRWRVVEPAGAEIAPDLVAAAVATLTAGQVSEWMVEAAGRDLTTFGLATPASEIEVTMRGEPERTVRVLLGARNPTKTALYAKRDDAPAVYLVGLNVRYYEDLIFEAAARGG